MVEAPLLIMSVHIQLVYNLYIFDPDRGLSIFVCSAARFCVVTNTNTMSTHLIIYLYILIISQIGIAFDIFDLTPYENHPFTDIINVSDVTNNPLKGFQIDVTNHPNHELHIYTTPWGSCDFDLRVVYSSSNCSDSYSIKSNQYDKSKVDDDFGSKYVIINASELNQQFVCIAIFGWTPGKYSILYRYNNITAQELNPFTINNNEPQFFIIHKTSSKDDNSLYAMIKFEIEFDLVKSSTNIISFHIDSYHANNVWFKCWITVNPDIKTSSKHENAWSKSLTDGHILYQHTDPLLSELRIKPTDEDAIKCMRDVRNNITSCNGLNGRLNITNDEKDNQSYIYFIVRAVSDDDNNNIDNQLNELQITINQEAEESKNHTKDASEQLSLFTGETMWNALTVKYLYYIILYHIDVISKYKYKYRVILME